MTCRAQVKPFSFHERDAERQKKKAAAAAAADEQTVLAGAAAPLRALPVPPSTAEPRYAMLVADAQLRQAGHATAVPPLQEQPPHNIKQGERVADAVVTVAAAAPKRPQSAARVKSPSLVSHMDALPEEEGLEESIAAYPPPSAPPLPVAGGSGAW